MTLNSADSFELVVAEDALEWLSISWFIVHTEVVLVLVLLEGSVLGRHLGLENDLVCLFLLVVVVEPGHIADIGTDVSTMDQLKISLDLPPIQSWSDLQKVFSMTSLSKACCQESRVPDEGC